MWYFIFIFAFLFCPKAVYGVDPFYGYETHPNFWNAGNYTKTGKNYLNTISNSNYNSKWVLSEPYNPNSNYRILVYQYYQNNNATNIDEWELWYGDGLNHQATNHSYGGKNETESRKAYLTQEKCLKGEIGYNWPQINDNSFFNFTTLSLASDNRCTHTGYIAIHMYEIWGSAFSALRNQKCNEYVPSSISNSGNRICISAPNVAPVYQRYAASTTSTGVPKYRLGCEATVYAWGYPYSENMKYNNWFRNGELRWSQYLSIGEFETLPAPDDHPWWNERCLGAWTNKQNWIYSGNYKLDNKIFTDTGDPPPTPTPKPPTNTPKPTATPTRIPTPTPTRLPTITPTKTNTPTPTKIPTLTPTKIPSPTLPSLCTQCSGKPGAKLKGDSDCSGTTTLNDIFIWKRELTLGEFGTIVKDNWIADFDCNGKVTLNDASIWRENFVKSL